MPIEIVERFEVTRLQVLDERGEVDEALAPTLDEAQLVELYRGMVHARHADQRMLKLQRQGRLGTFPPCTGQEATACGAAYAMRPTDWLVPTYRELGARLLRGEPLERTLAYYGGYEEGSAYSVATRNLPVQVILGAQIPHAVGLAWAMRRLGESETAVVAFAGDGATSEGDFHEGLNLAGVWQVPLVVVCQDNGWAISVPRAAQTRARTLAQKAIAYGIPGVQVDGNDVLAVYRAVGEALERARAGGGPTLIDALTYRLMMHTTADDPTKYRERAEEEEAWKRDPIPRFRTYLERRGIWDATREGALAAALKTQIEEAVASHEAMGAVAPDLPFDHVFQAPVAAIERQRAAFLRDLGEDRADG